jgi:hypothetical protein
MGMNNYPVIQLMSMFKEVIAYKKEQKKSQEGRPPEPEYDISVRFHNMNLQIYTN